MHDSCRNRTSSHVAFSQWTPLSQTTHCPHTRRAKLAALSLASVHVPLVSRQALYLICSLQCSAVLRHTGLCAFLLFSAAWARGMRGWMKESCKRKCLQPASAFLVFSVYIYIMKGCISIITLPFSPFSPFVFPALCIFHICQVCSAVASNTPFPAMATWS